MFSKDANNSNKRRKKGKKEGKNFFFNMTSILITDRYVGDDRATVSRQMMCSPEEETFEWLHMTLELRIRTTKKLFSGLENSTNGTPVPLPAELEAEVWPGGKGRAIENHRTAVSGVLGDVMNHTVPAVSSTGLFASNLVKESRCHVKCSCTHPPNKGTRGNFGKGWVSITLLVGLVYGCLHVSKLIKLCALNLCRSLYTNYTSIKNRRAY